MKSLLTILFLFSSMAVYAQRPECDGVLHMDNPPSDLRECYAIKYGRSKIQCCPNGDGLIGYYQDGVFHETRIRVKPTWPEECGRVNVCRQTSIAGMTCYTHDTCEDN